MRAAAKGARCPVIFSVALAESESHSSDRRLHPNVKITVLGTVFFIVLVAAFFAWFGVPPTIAGDFHLSRRGISRAWFYCSLLFVTGAGTACFGDKEYGMFPPTSLRWLVIAFGVLIMVISTAWMHSMIKG